jgi:hypothetical protein
MTQIFSRRINFFSRLTIFGAVFIVAAVAIAIGQIVRSPYLTGAHVVRVQPVAFSHKHHVGEIGIDCRYCHSSVENSSFAGIPSTRTCMNCHSQVWSDSPALQPVRDSFRDNTSIAWVRVNNLPDYVYFDHSIHLNKGVGCVTCHGPVDEMPLTWRENTLTMEWCLECHRDPARFVRPRDQIFAMHWRQSVTQSVLGPELVAQYRIAPPERLTNCSTCHR